MENNIKISILTIVAIILSSLVTFTITEAAVDLDPNGIPSATMKTLEDIYQRIIAGTAAGTHYDYPSATPAGTMRTLSAIYSAIPTNSEVCSGVNAGTAYCDPTEWSTVHGAEQWSVAKAYCENPANGYTRLPTLDELTKAISQQYLESGAGPIGFSNNVYYWSDNDSPQSGKGVANYNTPFEWVQISGLANQPDTTASFRCVR